MARRPAAPVRAGTRLPHPPAPPEHQLRRRELARPDAPVPSPRGRQPAHLSPPDRRHLVHRAAASHDIGECAERRAEKYGRPALCSSPLPDPGRARCARGRASPTIAGDASFRERVQSYEPCRRRDRHIARRDTASRRDRRSRRRQDLRATRQCRHPLRPRVSADAIGAPARRTDRCYARAPRRSDDGGAPARIRRVVLGADRGNAPERARRGRRCLRGLCGLPARDSERLELVRECPPARAIEQDGDAVPDRPARRLLVQRQSTRVLRMAPALTASRR